ncbi:MAG: hypothetical protein JOZ16_07880 [Methylobacteriaceae bacterium]|nr:hypothetical protein [Methylobacteriaceae bacterium]
MRFHPALLSICALAFASAALAQTQLKTKPYEPVQASYDRAVESDPALKARIEAIRQAVSAHMLAPLEAMISGGYVPLSCSNDPLAPCAPGQSKVIGKMQGRPADRLRTALCCEGEVPADVSRQDQEETVFGFFATALEENSVSAHPDIPGSACLPALAKFDHAKAEKAVQAAGIDPENLRVAGGDIPLREKPAEDAPVALNMKQGDLMPLVVELTMSIPAGWNSIALPKGGLGFTDQVGINELTPPAICFLKFPNGEWQIAFTIQRGG